jgi:hypothetical protein
MSGRRIVLLFVYAFASMIVPVLVALLLTEFGDPAFASWIIDNIAATLLVFLVYGLAQVLVILPLIGSWAATVEPRTDARLPKKELLRKMLSLNDERLPFAVVQDSADPNVLTASWKIAHERWIELFAARGLRIQYELRMRLLEDKGVVEAQDNLRRFEYAAGLGGRGIRFRSRFSFFKGISLFQYQRGLQYGVIYKDGELKINYAYNYTFSMPEIKNPIIDIVTESGWMFKPVVLLKRFA